LIGYALAALAKPLWRVSVLGKAVLGRPDFLTGSLPATRSATARCTVAGSGSRKKTAAALRGLEGIGDNAGAFSARLVGRALLRLGLALDMRLSFIWRSRHFRGCSPFVRFRPWSARAKDAIAAKAKIDVQLSPVPDGYWKNISHVVQRRVFGSG